MLLQRANFDTGRRLSNFVAVATNDSATKIKREWFLSDDAYVKKAKY